MEFEEIRKEINRESEGDFVANLEAKRAAAITIIMESDTFIVAGVTAPSGEDTPGKAEGIITLGGSLGEAQAMFHCTKEMMLALASELREAAGSDEH